MYVVEATHPHRASAYLLSSLVGADGEEGVRNATCPRMSKRVPPMVVPSTGRPCDGSITTEHSLLPARSSASSCNHSTPLHRANSCDANRSSGLNSLLDALVFFARPCSFSFRERQLILGAEPFLSLRALLLGQPRFTSYLARIAS